MTAHDEKDIEIVELKARISTLEQLLEVHERSVIQQSDRLYAEQERMRFQKLLLECQGEASIDGILSVGVDGTILFANRRLSEMWRIPAPSIGTKSYEPILQEMARRTLDPASFLARSAALQSAQEAREELSLGDGRTFDQYAAPICSADGTRFGRVWHFRDITAFKEIERLKDEFISSVSHELRTPLTSIHASLGLLAAGVLGELPSEAEAVVGVAQRNSDRLTRLINDVLDIEKIETGHLDLRLEVTELEPLLEQSVEAIRPYGDPMGVSFRIQNSVPGIRARVDSDRLIQVLDNLLSNAAKFSPPGGSVQIGLCARDGRVRVSVTDQGPGIAREFQSRVFDKFAQGAPEASRQKGGTGLGLNIARAIVTRLGGTIGFVSTPGAGASFYFELPQWREDGGAAGS